MYNRLMAKKIKKETIFQIGGIILCVGAFAGAVIAVSNMLSKPKTEDTVTTTYSGQIRQASTLLYNGKQYQMRDNVEVIVVMGIDDRDEIGNSNTYINNSQADVIYVYAVDHENKTYQALQINRDTVTGIQTLLADGTKDSIVPVQIALAHGYGRTEEARCLNVVEAVAALMYDVPVDHYISLNMSAISVMNEQVGGVTVTVPAGLESADPAFVEGSTVTLHGDQAEKFVRSRLSLDDNTNEFRMQRQQIFLNAWKEQANTKMNSDSSFALNLVFALSDYMTSDMSASALSDFATQLSDYQDLGTLKTVGETLEPDENRSFREYYIDSDDLQAKVIELFYEEAPSDSEN